MNYRYVSLTVLPLLLMMSIFATAVYAQSYPAKTVRVVIGFAPGTGMDIMARLLTPRLAEMFGQQFIVDNRAGANGVIGAEIAARATPDGYTLLAAPASLAVNQSLYKNLSFNLARDFEPISLLASLPYVLVVNPSLPVKNVKELIALTKNRRGQLNYASTGSGSTPHLTMELVKLQAGIDVVHVPYKGTPAAVTELIAGQVSMMFANTLAVLPHVRAGRLRALAVTSAKRSMAAAELPTIAESGLPGFESISWFVLLAPAGTPREIVTRLNTATTKIGQTAEMRESLAAQGADPLGGTPEQVGAFIKSEIVKLGKVVAASGARVD